MNIFFLDFDTKKCAKYHCDKHVVKMILETAQLLCGVHHMTPQVAPQVTPMQRTGQENGALLYQAEVTPYDSGVIHFGVRARPQHQGLIHPNETGVSRWA